MLAQISPVQCEAKINSEEHLTSLIAQVPDTELRIALRTAFQKHKNIVDIALLTEPPPPEKPNIIVMPAPKIAGLLPAPKRPDTPYHRIEADPAYLHYQKMAEQTRKHYARHPELAEKRAEDWRLNGYPNATAQDVIEAMSKPDWWRYCKSPHKGLRRRTESGALQSVLPHTRPITLE